MHSNLASQWVDAVLTAVSRAFIEWCTVRCYLGLRGRQIEGLQRQTDYNGDIQYVSDVCVYAMIKDWP